MNHDSCVPFLHQDINIYRNTTDCVQKLMLCYFFLLQVWIESMTNFPVGNFSFIESLRPHSNVVCENRVSSFLCKCWSCGCGFVKVYHVSNCGLLANGALRLSPQGESIVLTGIKRRLWTRNQFLHLAAQCSFARMKMLISLKNWDSQRRMLNQLRRMRGASFSASQEPLLIWFDIVGQIISTLATSANFMINTKFHSSVLFCYFLTFYDPIDQ